MSKIATAVFDGEVLRPSKPLELERGKSYAIGDETERVSKEHIAIPIRLLFWEAAHYQHENVCGGDSGNVSGDGRINRRDCG